MSCVPLLDMEALKAILDRDIAIWSKKGFRQPDSESGVKSSKDSRFFKLLAARKHLLDACVRKSQQLKEPTPEPMPVPDELKLPTVDRKEP